jgi:hypothetical protein
MYHSSFPRKVPACKTHDIYQIETTKLLKTLRFRGLIFNNIYLLSYNRNSHDRETWSAPLRGNNTRAVWKFRVLTLLLRVGTFWRCDDGLFFEVPPLASDALLTTLHPLLENVLQTVCRKLQEDSGTGGFDLWAPFLWLEKPRNRMGRDLGCMADVLMGFHRSQWAHPLPLFNRETLTLQ